VQTRNKALSLDRTLSVAADMLVERGIHNMSVSEVARIARCSTSTIYDAFESKDELCYQAIAYAQRRRQSPNVALPADDDAAFDRLLDYLERRILFLNDGRSRQGFLALAAQGDRTHRLARDIEEDRLQIHRLVDVAAAAMRAGMLRRASPESVAYCLSAAASFEPMTACLLRGDRIAVDEVLRHAVEPFVSEEARPGLEAFIAAAAERQRADRDETRPVEHSWLHRGQGTMSSSTTSTDAAQSTRLPA